MAKKTEDLTTPKLKSASGTVQRLYAEPAMCFMFTCPNEKCGFESFVAGERNKDSGQWSAPKIVMCNSCDQECTTVKGA